MIAVSRENPSSGVTDYSGEKAGLVPVPLKLDVPGLQATEVRGDGFMIFRDNLEDRTVQAALEGELKRKPYLLQLLADVKNGDKRAIAVLSMGSILIMVAAAGTVFELTRSGHATKLADLIKFPKR